MHQSETPNFLAGGGAMGELIRAYDWSRTELGPTDSWPQSLRTVVRLMLNTRHPVFVFWGALSTCLYNDAYSTCIGPDRHPSALGRPAREVWQEIWPTIGPQIEQVMTGGGATWHENQLLPITRGDQVEDVYWTYSYSPIDDEASPRAIGGVLVVVSETTQSVVAAKKLAESQERLQLALSAGRGIGTWDWDVVNDRVVADERFARLYGVDVQRAAKGAPIADFFAGIHPADLAEVQQQVDATLNSAAPFSAEYRLLGKGSETWVVAEGRCEFDNDGKPLRFHGLSFDITARRQAEDRLRELNANLERAVIERTQARGLSWQVSPDLMGALNSEGYFVTSNPAWKSVLGWSEEEVASMSIFDFLHPDDVETTRRGFDLTQVGQPAVRFPNRYRCKDGGYRWISWTGVPEDGMVYCTGRDITDERRQAELLKQTQDALRHSQKMEALGQLTGGMAHDFNNMLQGIMMPLEAIRRAAQLGRTDTVEKFANAGLDSARRAATITHRLLAFSRRQPMSLGSLDCAAAIMDLEVLLKNAVGENVQLRFEFESDCWRVLTDQHQFENAVINLAINARDAMPAGGTLTFKARNVLQSAVDSKTLGLISRDYLQVSVCDDGIGMSSDTASQAFEPFFTTKPLGQGTGLGLSMIYGFAKQSGGLAAIESQEGKGTCVHLWLPRSDGLAISGSAAAERGPGAKGKHSILVVEDDDLVRTMTAQALRDAGYTVLEAADATAAFAQFDSGAAVDVMLSDVGMPGLNGRQLADAALQRLPHLKVVLMTGYAAHVVAGDLTNSEIQLLTKPFENSALLITIANACASVDADRF